MSAQGSSGRFSRIVETALSSDSVVGDQVFPLNEHAPRNNIMDYFYFVDSDGVLVKQVTGTVEITLSPVDGIFQSVPNGVFPAHDVTDKDWQKPNGFGKAVAILISFASIKGAAGFRSNITQSVG